MTDPIALEQSLRASWPDVWLAESSHLQHWPGALERSAVLADPFRPPETDDEPWPLYPVTPPRHIPWRWLALALVLLIAWRKL